AVAVNPFAHRRGLGAFDAFGILRCEGRHEDVGERACELLVGRARRAASENLQVRSLPHVLALEFWIELLGMYGRDIESLDEALDQHAWLARKAAEVSDPVFEPGPQIGADLLILGDLMRQADVR